MRYVVLDTETTGLEVRQGHRIIEIGCIEVNGRQVTDHHFTSTSIRSARLMRVHSRCTEFPMKITDCP